MFREGEGDKEMSGTLINGHGHNWKGGRGISGDRRYIIVWNPDHPRESNGYVLEHLLIAEKVMGKLLPFPIVVHHRNGIGIENQPKNLVVCENTGYHTLIHARQRALENSGHADWKKCYYCHEYDSINNLIKANGCLHSECRNKVTRLKRVNTFPGYTTSKSGFRGVYKADKGYRARICVDGHNVHLGHFMNKEEAAQAYNEAAIKRYGEFARLNKGV